MEKNTGGAAFPRPHSECNESRRGSGCVESQNGMTLRDYFAAKALVGFLSADRHYDPLTKDDAPKLAADCYALADAMLKERAK